MYHTHWDIFIHIFGRIHSEVLTVTISRWWDYVSFSSTLIFKYKIQSTPTKIQDYIL